MKQERNISPTIHLQTLSGSANDPRTRPTVRNGCEIARNTITFGRLLRAQKIFIYTHVHTTGYRFNLPHTALYPSPFPFASQHHVLLSISDLRCLFLEHRYHRRRRRRQRQKSDLFPLRMRETNSHTPPNYGLRRAWWKGQRKWRAEKGRTGDFSVPERPVARAMDIGSSFCPTWDAFPLHTRCEDGMRDPIPQKAECARSTAH